MAELPILPLKTDALLADTGHMSAEEFGAYCRILFTMWRHSARLPDAEMELARIAGVPLPRWRKISECVLRPITVAGGQLSQKRLTDTWLQVQELRRKRAASADVRWSSKRNANAYADAQHMQSNRNANQNQIINTSSFEEGSAGSRATPSARSPAQPLSASPELRALLATKGSR